MTNIERCALGRSSTMSNDTFQVVLSFMIFVQVGISPLSKKGTLCNWIIFEGLVVL